ncbi:MAG: VOC family protein [Steroidobacteraceae bacterium]
MKISPHLAFDGTCREAFEFYANTFGGKIIMLMTYGESPAAAQVPADMRDQVIHARVDIGGQYLMGADAPATRFRPAQGIMVMAAVESRTEAERVFNALASNGNVTMPYQETFWAHGFGMCTDRYGVPWMINCEKGG